MAANESAAVAAMKTYHEAQEIFRNSDGDHVNEYARQLRGDQSLFETKAGLGDRALVDDAMAAADALFKDAAPKAGYVFKVLTSQGPAAPGGSKNYLNKNGDLVNGFALIGAPASWEGTGRNTFLINHTGIVYQQDLGVGAPEVFETVTEYNPDSSWIVAD